MGWQPLTFSICGAGTAPLCSCHERVRVFSAGTGQLLWDCTSRWELQHARGWELRMWTCAAINCRQYFSVILLVRQLFLCDMAFISEYVVDDSLVVYLVRRQIMDPSILDLQQAAEAIRQSSVTDFSCGRYCLAESTCASLYRQVLHCTGEPTGIGPSG